MSATRWTAKDSVREALLAAMMSAAAPPALAGDSDQSANASDVAQLGKIEVTGTRIRRTEVETAQPVTIITVKEIKATGLTSVGDILNTLPQVRSVLNSQVNNGNDGSTTIDLRYLGSNRVLVLVDGRRWIGGVKNQVDFNTLPASIIDHIEILQDGATAIYGSDAISGVVNVITVKNYDGAEANAFWGTYHGDGHTDGRAQTYDFTLGTASDRSAVTMNAGYTNLDGLSAADRNISKEPFLGSTGTALAILGSTRTPAGRFRIVPVVTGSCPGAATLNPQGYCNMTLIRFPAAPSLSNFRDFHVADRFNYAPFNYLVAPNETTNLYVQDHYDLADNVTFTSELLSTHRDSVQQLAQGVVDIGARGSTVGGAPINIDKTNPYNPFGVTLTSNTQDPCLTASSCDLLLSIGRRFVENGPRVLHDSQQAFHFAGGFKGFFSMLDGEWDWDTSAGYSRQSETISERGATNLLHLAQGLGPAFNAGTASSPDFKCGTPKNTVAGCVPIDLFGGAGTLTPAMTQWLALSTHDVIDFEQRDYTANLTGTLFNMPAGPAATAIGTEYLEADGFVHPDSSSVGGLNAEGTSTPTDGRQTTESEYVEFDLPLLANRPFAKDMDLDVAERWSQFKWNGGTPSLVTSSVIHRENASTGRVALKWQTSDALLLRASWSQGFRLPSISELFLNQSTVSLFTPDPCAKTPFTWNGNPATYPPGCPRTTSGSPNPHNQPDLDVNTVVGGNASLKPEKSTSRTAGFVYNPDWLQGFDFSADYFKIEVLQYVSSLSGATILSECYFAQVPAACTLITIKSGEISSIQASNQNVGSELTEGVDLGTHYKFTTATLGDFKLEADVTFNKIFNTVLPNTSSPKSFAANKLSGWAVASGSKAFAYPKQKADVSVAWNYGTWTTTYTVRYTGPMWELCNFGPSLACSDPTYSPNEQLPILGPAVGPGRNHLGAVTYHDINVTIHMDAWSADFSLGVRNLFGKQPPTSTTAYANSYIPFYDVPGQFLYGRLGAKF